MKMAERHVVFSDDAVHFSAPEHEKTESSDSEDEYYEITSTSEAESLATSDEEDAELLEVALDGAYSCSPSVFLKSTRDPAERSSLLLLDKDFLYSEGM